MNNRVPAGSINDPQDEWENSSETSSDEESEESDQSEEDEDA